MFSYCGEVVTGDVGLIGAEGELPKPEPPDPKPEPPLLDPKPVPVLEPKPVPVLFPNPVPVLEPNPVPVVPLAPVPLPLRFVPAPAVASSALWLGSNTNSHWL